MKRLLMLLVLMWVCREFWTMNALVEFLNTLPEARQIEAKIADKACSQYHIGYYLLYRE